ncbi:MAG: hypothetical protein M3451_10585 [Chloroflexota bacterium]|nr:hypothetical protein [Chloroflexota bacterium]
MQSMLYGANCGTWGDRDAILATAREILRGGDPNERAGFLRLVASARPLVDVAAAPPVAVSERMTVS